MTHTRAQIELWAYKLKAMADELERDDSNMVLDRFRLTDEFQKVNALNYAFGVLMERVKQMPKT